MLQGYYAPYLLIYYRNIHLQEEFLLSIFVMADLHLGSAFGAHDE